MKIKEIIIGDYKITVEHFGKAGKYRIINKEMSIVLDISRAEADDLLYLLEMLKKLDT